MVATIEFSTVEIDRLKPYLQNARTHSKKQVEQLAASVAEHGFINPVLMNEAGILIAGHGRLRGARKLGMTIVPAIIIRGLSDAQERRLRISDNKLALNAGWDPDLLQLELKSLELEGLDLSFTGFSPGELDVLFQPKMESVEKFDPVPLDAVTELGDIWICDRHRIGCGDLLDDTSLRALMVNERAAAIIGDSPYNTENATHNGGSGQFRHREFQYAHGEMSSAQFVEFLTNTQRAMAGCCRDGAVAFMFMDHHHAGEQIEAGQAAFGRRLNIAIWVKSNAGMGSLYRSQHEMVFVYVVGDGPHRNNVELGKHGRNRTNVWQASSVNTFGSRQDDLQLHATVKPVGMIADAIKDVTLRGEVVLDGFLGSGTTLIAAERTNRRGFGLEIEPAYVDVAITRWTDLTGREPVLESTGERFSEVKLRRAMETPQRVSNAETTDV